MKKIWFSLAVLIMTACTNNTGTKNDPAKKDADHGMHSMGITDTKGYCDSVNTGLIAEDTLDGSPGRTAMTTVHGTHVHIEYNSPGVKGRVIWGGLVPYDKVWVTGAHQATRITFYKDVTIADKKIPKGTYALFTIPGKSAWTIILNKNYDQHLTDAYDEKEDISRITILPEDHPFTPRLTYGVEELPGNEGAINIVWEKVKVTLLFKTV